MWTHKRKHIQAYTQRKKKGKTVKHVVPTLFSRKATDRPLHPSMNFWIHNLISPSSLSPYPYPPFPKRIQIQPKRLVRQSKTRVFCLKKKKPIAGCKMATLHIGTFVTAWKCLQGLPHSSRTLRIERGKRGMLNFPLRNQDLENHNLRAIEHIPPWGLWLWDTRGIGNMSLEWNLGSQNEFS